MNRALCAATILFLLAACGTETVIESPPDAAVAVDSGASSDSGEPTPDAGDVDAGTPPEDAGDLCSQPRPRSIVRLTIEPSGVTVDQGNKARIAVTATFDDGCTALVTGNVYYRVADTAIARVVDIPSENPNSAVPDKAVEGLAKGQTTVVASTQDGGGGIASAPTQVTVNEQAWVPGSTETRGVWVTRFAFHSDATQGPADVRRIINAAADNNFNAVYFQVRGVADAYYHSSLVPFWLHGTSALGNDPGWDPLQVAIDAAHARGILLYAYINAMSGWSKSGTTPSAIPASAAGAPEHILRQHPEYTCKSASGQDDVSEYTYIAADPGYIAHFADVVEELITRYSVDGIHMDRIRTPGRGYCHTPALDALYHQQYPTASDENWGAFSRAQIDKVVEAVYQRVLSKKPTVIVSAAVWGIYKKLPGCSTSQGYYDYHQDSLGWMSRGIIDQLCPMIYWDLHPGSCTDWGALVDSFVAGANGRQIVAGMHALESDDTAHFDRITARIQYARSKQIAGNVVFASAYLDQQSIWDDYLAGPYAQPEDPTPITHR